MRRGSSRYQTHEGGTCDARDGSRSVQEDRFAIPAGRPLEARGARTVAEEIAVFGANARYAEAALVDGRAGIAVAPQGRLRLVLTFTIDGGVVTAYELVAEPDRLARLDLAVLDS